MRWLIQNWPTVVEVGYAAINLVVGLSPSPRVREGAGPARRALDTVVSVLGRVAVVTHHDAPGTLKLPGARADGRKAWMETGSPPADPPPVSQR